MAVRAGNRRAFEELYERYAVALYNFFVRTTGLLSFGEKLYSILFVRAYRAAHNYEPRESFRIWLFRHGRDVVREQWDLEGYKPRWDETDPRAALEIDPELTAIGYPESLARVREALLHLLPTQREVVVLEKYHGFSLAQIARIVRTTEGEVRTRLCTGMAELRRLLVERET